MSTLWIDAPCEFSFGMLPDAVRSTVGLEPEP